ncbi:hypothetical protein KHA80_04080 [Anaerobacillus sp. HL2]|nr:hypothetical protein KHA80_04080 [Anaerobacillus sp. HL2]
MIRAATTYAEPFDAAKSFWYGNYYFSDGKVPLLQVMLRGKWGFIDEGNFVVSLQFDEVGTSNSISITEGADKKNAFW